MSYLGRLRRGGSLPMVVVLPSPPTACPQVDIWLSGQSKVDTFQLASRKPNNKLFALNRYLGSLYTDGRYVATIRYTISGVTTVIYHTFEIRGGSSIGCSLAITEMRRPLGRAIVMHREDGNISMGYNPRTT